MKKTWKKATAFSILLGLLAPVSLLAQKDEKGDKEEKIKKEVRQVIITSKGDKEEKMTVEINGDKVTINGKPLDEYKDKDGDIKVKMHKLKDVESLTMMRTPGGQAWSFDNRGGDDFPAFKEDENRAMLGVTTDEDEKGARVKEVTKESAAEKIGLKADDIITKIGDKKIESPDDLTAAIKEHKPGDKVAVTYLRDKKEMKATAELTKWKGVRIITKTIPGQNMNLNLEGMNLEGMDFERIMPRLEGLRGTAPFGGQNWSWSGGSPKLGLSVQDTDDGKGVKVIEVDEESNAAKSGIKEEDIITHIDDKAVNNVDEISKLLREKKENPTVRFQLTRSGKSQNIEVKMPRKIKTADL